MIILNSAKTIIDTKKTPAIKAYIRFTVFLSRKTVIRSAIASADTINTSDQFCNKYSLNIITVHPYVSALSIKL